jgi:hypothetical protein
MSKVTERRTYNGDAATVREAILRAGEAAKLKPSAASMEDALVMGESFNLFSFSWPAKVTAVLSGDDTTTTVDYTASNFGLGPLQTNRVKGALAKVTSALASLEAA